MGLYYFYHNSPKQHQNLSRMFEALQQLPAFATRAGGTRWVGHMVLAIETFLKSHKPIVWHLEDGSLQKKSTVTAADKARGFLKLSKCKDVLGYLHVLLDMLKPLKYLSVALQSSDTTLAEVHDKVQMAQDVLQT